MEKFKKEIEINRYSMQKGEMFYTDFQEEIGLDYIENLKVYFNLNNSGQRDFHNFLKREEKEFTSIKDIEELSKELSLDKWLVISFYRENGYNGIYTRTGSDALKIKCNNWINYGQDGYMYIVFSDNQKVIDDFIKQLDVYINEGLYCYEVYDELEEDYTEDRFCNIDVTYTDFNTWKNEMITKYGFIEKDFE